jgi:hypothetical protein
MLFCICLVASGHSTRANVNGVAMSRFRCTQINSLRLLKGEVPANSLQFHRLGPCVGHHPRYRKIRRG